jgi:ribose/xylose/arabinose/galactoside ABC-type transport system permease subunit
MKIFKNFTLYLLLLAIIVVIGIISPLSVSPNQLLIVVAQAIPLILAAAGQSIVILVGGIDLSIYSVIMLTNVLSCSMIAGKPENNLIARVVCLGLGTLIGLANGLGINYAGIPDFVMTLGVSVIVQGIVYTYSKGSPIGSIKGFLCQLTNDKIWIIPYSVIVGLGVILFLIFILYKTTFGKKLYSTGGNMKASMISGINVKLVRTLAYTMCGFLTALSGLFLSGFVGVASLGLGSDYVMNSIAATILGGAAFAGGILKLENTVVGALLLTFLFNLLTILNVGQPGKYIMQGVVIVGIAYVYLMFRRNKNA